MFRCAIYMSLRCRFERTVEKHPEMKWLAHSDPLKWTTQVSRNLCDLLVSVFIQRQRRKASVVPYHIRKIALKCIF